MEERSSLGRPPRFSCSISISIPSYFSSASFKKNIGVKCSIFVAELASSHKHY